MKKMFGKITSILIISAMATSMLSGCGGASSSGSSPTDTIVTSDNTASSNSDISTNTESGSADYTSLKKYEPGIKITISSTISPEDLQKENGSMETGGNWGNWDKDTLGITYVYKWVATDGGDAAQKLQLGIASGDMPDVISDTNPDLIQQLASADQIYCLQDLIEQYGSPLTKYMYDEYNKQAGGKGFAPVTYNGKYYAGPRILDTVQQASDTQWIRQDILDQLGMEMPTNIKELGDVYAAYKAKYPSNYPYLYSLNFTDLMNSGEAIYSAFGAHPQHWIEKDGKVVYGSIQPEAKTALLTLQEWYKNGYIDPDFASKDFWTQGTSFTNGDMLSMTTPFWGYGWSFGPLNRAIPTSKVVPMPIINGPNGEPNDAFYLSFTTPWPTAISKSFDHPEAVIYELNMAFDSFFRNDDDLRSKFDFIYPKTDIKEPNNPDVVKAEGIDKATYDYTDAENGPGFFQTGNQHAGGPALISDKTSANILIDSSLRINDAINSNSFDSLSNDDKAFYNASIANRENTQGNQMAIDAHLANSVQMQDYFSKGFYKYDAFLGAPTENMKNTNAYLTKIELQTYADIITGKASIDTFDKFVADWSKNGGDTVTQDVNDWYNQNK